MNRRGRVFVAVHWGGDGSHQGRYIYDATSLAPEPEKPIIDPVRIFQPDRESPKVKLSIW